MTKSEYPAIALTTMLSNYYPNCWNLIEYVREGKGKGLPDWSDRCYIPISGTIAIVTGGAVLEIAQQKNLPILAATTMAAIAPWRLY